MTKSATPTFRVRENADGAPIIVIERTGGENLNLFQKMIGFGLPAGVSLSKAETIARYLNQNLLRVSEW